MDVKGFDGLAAHFEQVGKRLSHAIDQELNAGMERPRTAERDVPGGKLPRVPGEFVSAEADVSETRRHRHSGKGGSQ